MASRTSTTSRGFTLVEAMMASAVLAGCVSAMSGALSASYANRRAAEREAEALAVARQLVEEVAARPVTINADPASTTTGSLGANGSGEPVEVNDTVTADSGETFDRSVSLEAFAPGGGDPQLALITVRVKAEDGREVTLFRVAADTEGRP